MNNNNLPNFQAQVHGPNGEQPVDIAAPTHAIAEDLRIPPSRERVAQVVAEEEHTHWDPRDPRKSLRVLLRAAATKLYPDTGNDNLIVFPHALLVEVFTRERIQESLSFESAEAKPYNIDDCVRRICGSGGPDELGRFARIFATLVHIQREQDIFQFFEREVDDTGFPFGVKMCRDYESGSLCPKFPSESFAPTGWNILTCEHFGKTQWMAFLPYFDSRPENSHQTFEPQRIMPWYDCHLRTIGSTSSTTASSNGGISALGGGHSDVSRVFIYDGHHKFDGLNQAHGSPVSFAVKRLRTKNQVDFDQEVAMLRKLGGKKEHTVRLLATFRCGETYCLLFPWAECDLLAYWHREEGLQKREIDLIQWVSVQCHGLMSAINWIHDPKVLGQDNLELFGRHGDIKPENILWYKASSPSANPLASGELSISDFGLSALNHKNTRSNIQNGNILHTTTYAPPESVLANHVISRAIDIWALGCVCLEFTTWLVGGPSLVEEFKHKRMSPFLGQIRNDVFWELQMVPNSGTVEVLKPEVVEWIQCLWNGPEATKYIRDFLDIITKHMLVTERAGRSNAQRLVSEFRSLVDRDAAYYTVPLGRGNKVLEVIQPPSIEKLSPNVQNVIQQSYSSGKPLRQFSGHSRPTSRGE